MAIFVLVHSPVVGPATLEPVAVEMRRRGFSAVAPALAAPLDSVRPWWSSSVDAVAAATADHRSADVPESWPGDLACGYLSYTYEAEARAAEAAGWVVARADGHHLQTMVDPGGVADAPTPRPIGRRLRRRHSPLLLILGALGIRP